MKQATSDCLYWLSPCTFHHHQYNTIKTLPCQGGASSLLHGVKGIAWPAMAWSVLQGGTDYNGLSYPNIMTILQMSKRDVVICKVVHGCLMNKTNNKLLCFFIRDFSRSSSGQGGLQWVKIWIMWRTMDSLRKNPLFCMDESILLDAVASWVLTSTCFQIIQFL